MVRGSSHAFPWGAWLSAAGIAGFAVGVFWMNHPQAYTAGQIALQTVVGVLGLVFLFLVYRAVVATLRHFRFSDIGLALNAEPVVAGSELGGTLKVPIQFTATHEFGVALIASELRAERSNDRYSTSTRELFRQESTVRGEPQDAGTLLRFGFRVPADAHQSLGYGEPVVWSDRTAGRVYVKWHLEFSADLPGIDLAESFEVPVVRPAASELPLLAGHNPSYSLERNGSELRVVQPGWKKPGRLGTIANLLGAGSLGAIFIAAMEVTERGHGLIGGALFIAGVGLALAVLGFLAHELAVDVDPDGLRIVRRIGTRTLMDVRLDRSQIAAVEAGSSFGRSGHNVAALTVRIRTRDGQTYTLAEFITRTRDVVALCNLIAARLALGPGAIAGAKFAQPAVHVYEAPTFAVERGIWRLVFVSILGWLAWTYVPVIIEANLRREAENLRREAADAKRERLRAAFEAEGKVKVEAKAKVEAKDEAKAPVETAVAETRGPTWWPSFERALNARGAQRFDEAEREFRRMLPTIEKELGPEHPVAGMIHHQLAVTYQMQGKADAREAPLKRALEILERHPAKAAKEALGPMGTIADKESVARELGDLFYDRRRYADAFGYYQRAYAAAAELDTTDQIRNERLALSAAGVMVTSCTLGKWDISDRAMAEVKQRYPAVPAASQSRLKYWIDTGEPRLKARQC